MLFGAFLFLVAFLSFRGFNHNNTFFPQIAIACCQGFAINYSETIATQKYLKLILTNDRTLMHCN